MRSKVAHVELVLDNADKRHMNTEGSIRSQLGRAQRARRARAGAFIASQDTSRALKSFAKSAIRATKSYNSLDPIQVNRAELRSQIAATGEVEARKLALGTQRRIRFVASWKNYSSKERQLRTVGSLL